MRKVTLNEYIIELDEHGFYDNVIQESYWEDGCDVELMLRLTVKAAKKDNVEITDIDTGKYEDEFYTMYKDAQKGLS